MTQQQPYYFNQPSINDIPSVTGTMIRDLHLRTSLAKSSVDYYRKGRAIPLTALVELSNAFHIPLSCWLGIKEDGVITVSHSLYTVPAAQWESIAFEPLTMRNVIVKKANGVRNACDDFKIHNSLWQRYFPKDGSPTVMRMEAFIDLCNHFKLYPLSFFSGTVGELTPLKDFTAAQGIDRLVAQHVNVSREALIGEQEVHINKIEALKAEIKRLNATIRELQDLVSDKELANTGIKSILTDLYRHFEDTDIQDLPSSFVSYVKTQQSITSSHTIHRYVIEDDALPRAAESD